MIVIAAIVVGAHGHRQTVFYLARLHVPRLVELIAVWEENARLDRIVGVLAHLLLGLAHFGVNAATLSHVISSFLRLGCILVHGLHHYWLLLSWH